MIFKFIFFIQFLKASEQFSNYNRVLSQHGVNCCTQFSVITALERLIGYSISETEFFIRTHFHNISQDHPNSYQNVDFESCFEVARKGILPLDSFILFQQYLVFCDRRTGQPYLQKNYIETMRGLFLRLWEEHQEYDNATPEIQKAMGEPPPDFPNLCLRAENNIEEPMKNLLYATPEKINHYKIHGQVISFHTQKLKISDLSSWPTWLLNEKNSIVLAIKNFNSKISEPSVIFGTTHTSESYMNTIRANEIIQPPPLDSPFVEQGTHCITIIAYDPTKRAYLFKNTWGENYGDKGYGWIGEQYIEQFGIEAYVIYDILEDEDQ